MWEIFCKMQEKFLVYRLCFQEIIFQAVWAANRPESLILSCLVAYWASGRARVHLSSLGPVWPHFERFGPRS
jgi:hypothetical protein